MTPDNPARHAASSPERDQQTEPVYAVGVGPGDEAFLTQRAHHLLSDADVVVGFDTVVDRITDIGDPEILRCSYDNQTARLAEFGERIASGKRGVAVLWGDPNISGYQFLGRVERAVDRPVRVVPGISSVQIAASRSRIPFEHATFASLHRRGDLAGEFDRLADSLARGRHLVVIVRPYDWMPPDIARAILERGADSETPALVLEELTLPDESIERTTLGELAAVEATAQDRYSDRTILTVRATDTDD
jgi:cobalt-precorrin-7 (C5)-methyltransferase